MPSAPSYNGHSELLRPNWIPILGNWEIGDNIQTFTGGGQESLSHGQVFPMALAASSALLQNGNARVSIQFSAAFGALEQAAGLVVGYRSPDQHYVFAELGASGSAYSIGEFVPGFGWRPLVATGTRDNLRPDRNYVVELRIQGQELRVLIDDVPVAQHLLSRPLEGKQVGLIAAGNSRIVFTEFKVTAHRPRAFVAMEFSEPFDTFHREVILPQAEAAGFQVVRIDEKAGPGVIFQDIQREIEQSEIVIAEISPANTNVFYELGYAHALGKPTILLARRGSELPFDIRSYRVVFYNDTIGGKPEVERSLRRHLDAIVNQ